MKDLLDNEIIFDAKYIYDMFNSKKEISNIKNFIKTKVYESGCSGIVIGLSGGIDSSVVAKLCVKALGKKNVYGILMPFTKNNDIKDAIKMVEILGIEHTIIEIFKPLNSIIKLIEKSQFSSPRISETNIGIVPKGNLMARIRMCILYYHANQCNRLVVGTSNKTELLLGYFTKYGDGGVDIEPISHVYKTQVRKIAKDLHIPDSIINKIPSADLWEGQSDEKEIGMQYENIDSVLFNMIDRNANINDVAKKLNISVYDIERIFYMIKKNSHKMNVYKYE